MRKADGDSCEALFTHFHKRREIVATFLHSSNLRFGAINGLADVVIFVA